MSGRFETETLPNEFFFSFLEEREMKPLLCVQPSSTELSKTIRNDGLPVYSIRDDVTGYLKKRSTPIIWFSNEMSKNPYGLVIPEMYELVLTEIEWTRQLIKNGVDLTIAINENPMFCCWIKTQHYLVVDLLVDFFKEYIDFFDYNKLDKIFINTLFSHGTSPLTELFFEKCKFFRPQFHRHKDRAKQVLSH